jgi:hypothetical protein
MRLKEYKSNQTPIWNTFQINKIVKSVRHNLVQKISNDVLRNVILSLLTYGNNRIQITECILMLNFNKICRGIYRKHGEAQLWPCTNHDFLWINIAENWKYPTLFESFP